MLSTSPPVGPNPFVLFRSLDQLRDRMREWYVEWNAARRPLATALHPLGEERLVSGGDILDPSFIPCWLAAGAAIRASGLADLPAEMFAHRQLPPDIYPPLPELCKYTAWHLLTLATTHAEGELHTALRQAALYLREQTRPGRADEFQTVMAEACAGILREWERRNTMPFVERLKAEAERLGVSAQQVEGTKSFGTNNGERRTFANWITSWQRGSAWVGLERDEYENDSPPPEVPRPEVPAAVRSWLQARFLSDPCPDTVLLHPDRRPETAVFISLDLFADFLNAGGYPLLPTLDSCHAAGLIDDLRIDLFESDGSTDPPPSWMMRCVQRLQLAVGQEHRLVAIRRAVLDTPTEPPVPEVPPTAATSGTVGEEEPLPESDSSNTVEDWQTMGEAKRAVLTVLRKAAERMEGQTIAGKAGYKYGTLRHHFGDLQRWGYVDRERDGYAITPAGVALVPPCESV